MSERKTYRIRVLYTDAECTYDTVHATYANAREIAGRYFTHKDVHSVFLMEPLKREDFPNV